MNQRARTILALAAILLLAGALRWYRADESFNGYHGFNEIWYTVIAKNYRMHPLFEPTTLLNNVDRNVPPLVSWLLYGWYGLFGYSELAGRSLMILFNLGTLTLVFLMARRASGLSAAVVAGTLLAVLPIDVSTGRNVQTESVYTFFLLASLHFLVLSDGAPDRLKKVALSGACWGLSCLSKQFALFILPALAICDLLKPMTLKYRLQGAAVFGLSAAVALGPFFGYQALFHWSAAFGKQAGFLSLFGMPDWETLKWIVLEMRGGFTMPALLILLAGGAWGALRGGLMYRLCGVGGFCYLGMFLFLNFHAYYMFPAGPLLALCAGGLFAALAPKIRFALTPAVGAVAAFSCFSALSLLCGAKYGYDDFKQFGKFLEAAGRKDAIVIAISELSSQYFPILEYYAPDATVMKEADLAKEAVGASDRLNMPEGKPVLLAFLPNDPRINEFQGPLAEFSVARYAVSLFGRRFHQYPPNEHFFMRGPIQVDPAGPITEFGVVKVDAAPALVVRRVPANARLMVKNGKLTEKRVD